MSTTKEFYESIDRQQKYVEKAPKPNLIVGDAFIRGMRSLGYKNNAWALGEQVDNAIQADAKEIAVRFGFATGNQSRKRPDHIAVIDNGVGMIPQMLPYAVSWGGTDREDDRHGFGRFGYGLPSSAVSISTRYTVYSRTNKENWWAVTIDLEDVAAAARSGKGNFADLIRPTKKQPPSWTMEKMGHHDPSAYSSGTIVVHEVLDTESLDYKMSNTLAPELMKRFGLMYRYWMLDTVIYVNQKKVLPIDPLFLMPNAKDYDATPKKAVEVPGDILSYKAPSGREGKIRIKASLAPPEFFYSDGNPSNSEDSNIVRPVQDILVTYNGLSICREGRQIDCIQPKWTKFQNYDRYLRIEIDFDAELDECFGVTTSKQQITLKQEVWDFLVDRGGLRRLVSGMRDSFKEARAKVKADSVNKALQTPTIRPSVKAMETALKFKQRKRPSDPKKNAEAQKALEDEAKKRAVESGKSYEEELESLKKEVAGSFLIATENNPQGPYYRTKMFGTQLQVILNVEHPFYSRVYEPAGLAQSAIEVMLLVLAEAEADSIGEREIFYQTERNHWSQRLRYALKTLESDSDLEDQASLAEEIENPSDELVTEAEMA